MSSPTHLQAVCCHFFLTIASCFVYLFHSLISSHLRLPSAKPDPLFALSFSCFNPPFLQLLRSASTPSRSRERELREERKSSIEARVQHHKRLRERQQRRSFRALPRRRRRRERPETLWRRGRRRRGGFGWKTLEGALDETHFFSIGEFASCCFLLHCEQSWPRVLFNA